MTYHDVILNLHRHSDVVVIPSHLQHTETHSEIMLRERREHNSIILISRRVEISLASLKHDLKKTNDVLNKKKYDSDETHKSREAFGVGRV